MRITFDPERREATLRNRLVDFIDAGTVFDGLTYTFEDHRRPYPEPSRATSRPGCSPGAW